MEAFDTWQHVILGTWWEVSISHLRRWVLKVHDIEVAFGGDIHDLEVGREDGMINGSTVRKYGMIIVWMRPHLDRDVVDCLRRGDDVIK